MVSVAYAAWTCENCGRGQLPGAIQCCHCGTSRTPPPNGVAAIPVRRASEGEHALAAVYPEVERRIELPAKPSGEVSLLERSVEVGLRSVEATEQLTLAVRELAEVLNRIHGTEANPKQG